MHRPTTAFVVYGQDVLLQAINNAKNFAQRNIDFELSKVYAQLASVSPTNGANLSGLVLFGTATPVVAKSLKQAFLSNGSTQYPIEFTSRDSHINRLKRRYTENLTDNSPQTHLSETTPLSLVQVGDTVYLVNYGTGQAGSTTVYFDVVKWLPDFDGVTVNETNFLLTYCFDYMLFRTIYELNFFLKEDARVELTAKVLNEIWENMKSWNSTIIGNSVNDGELN